MTSLGKKLQAREKSEKILANTQLQDMTHLQVEELLEQILIMHKDAKVHVSYDGNYDLSEILELHAKGKKIVSKAYSECLMQSIAIELMFQ
jgi:hypothetical protein